MPSEAVYYIVSLLSFYVLFFFFFFNDTATTEIYTLSLHDALPILRSVMRGESWLSPAVSRQVVEGYVQRSGAEAAPDVLTAHQREVLRLVAGGKSTKEIAFFLNLSVKTVETHRAQIMERLGIRDVPGLVRYALRTGLVPPDG